MESESAIPTQIPLDPRQSLLRRKINSAGSKIKNIVDQGRLASSDPSQLVSFRGLFRSLPIWFDDFRRFWDDLLEHYSLVGDSNFPDQSDKNLCATVERYYNTANTLYEELVVVAEAIPRSHTSTSTDLTGGASNIFNSSRASLPRLTLPQFTGKLIEWPHFRDLFTSLVHEDVNIPEIDKFHYLASSLKGPALSVISNLTIIAANYQTAWTALNKNFNNKRLLASTYINQLLEFQPFKRGNLENFKLFLSVVAENVAALKRLEIPQLAEFILFSLSVKCLDQNTRQEFEKENIGFDYPQFDDLVNFVRNRCQVLELSSEINFEPQNSKQDSDIKKKNKPTASSSSFFVNETKKSSIKPSTSQNSISSKCPSCQGNHYLWRCSEFKQKSPRERLSLLTTWNRCLNCLQTGHKVKSCLSKGVCYVCSQKHHTLVHLSNQVPKSVNIPSQTSVIYSSNNTPSPVTSVESTTLTSTSSSDVILGTAMVLIKGSQNFLPVRLVVDSGSHYSFITSNCVQRLGLEITPFNKRITGVGQNLLKGVLGKVDCSLKPKFSSSILQTGAVVVNSITSMLPCSRIPIPTWFNEYFHKLADPNFFNPNEVEFLLGADLFPDIFTGRCFDSPDGCSKFLDTVFGLVVIGKLPSQTSLECTSLFAAEDTDLRSTLQQFWEIEEPIIRTIRSPDDNLSEIHYQATHYRLPTGQFGVRLPFKEAEFNFKESESVALKRFLNLESKLLKTPSLYNEYRRFMSEYIALGHMKITKDDSAYVIPHHGIFKGPKFRVVFDASCKINGKSLNDCLLTGEKLQMDISSILSNFRLHSIVFVTDMVKMFRQIEIDPRDRIYQHIFWRSDVSERIQKYELCSLTYGLSSSPYQALRTIKQLITDDGQNFPLASKALEEDLYIDDITTGANTLVEASKLKYELIELLGKGCFQLSKWHSNCPELISDVNTENSPVDFSQSDNHTIKILGLQWDPTSDSFTYKIHCPSFNSTKRCILSTIARLFDPLGFLAPTILFGKIILQATWQLKVDWDEPVPEPIYSRWVDFIQYLSDLEKVKIPRYLSGVSGNRCHLLCFSDASEVGYCAAIYLKIISPEQGPPFLLKAKTKLSPLKTLTIPKLELCGALLLSKLFNSLKSFINRINCEKIYCFTDSTVVLGWLNTEPHLLKIFVANRVVEITNALPPSHWHHIKSGDNPADCASRGVSPSHLFNHPLWWTGPSWLTGDYEAWPVLSFTRPVNLPELKPTCVVLTSVTSSKDLVELMNNFSSYLKLLRVIAYCLRFFNNCKDSDKQYGPIKPHEYRNARLVCVKAVQSVYFPVGDEVALKQLKSLVPFLDECGVLRVGGRLANSTLDQDIKHPMILPKQCYLSTLIIDHLHKTHLHAGPSLLVAILRKEFWIPSSRNLIRQRIFNCIICYRAKPRVPSQLMGHLPPSRLAGGRAFQHVGVDFAGPFLIRESLRRKAQVGKAYLCLFVCMASKALHLEVVSSLSTEAFLATLDRFISRRGKPQYIYSDCGSNFIGASKYLKDFNKWYSSSGNQDHIVKHLAPIDIVWNFNPPYAPHFGGLWEAGVKSVKTILRKCMSESSLTYEELATIFCRIEAVLNSRPLCPLTEDKDDYDYLTPGHFLIGAPLTSTPEPYLLDSKDNRLKRWQIVLKRLQQVWSRWQDEYLHLLQQRSKWNKKTPNISVGDLVILKDLNTRPLQWPMARVVQIHPGKDSLVRVVTVKTQKGEFTRPISKVIPLNVTSHNCSSDDLS